MMTNIIINKGSKQSKKNYWFSSKERILGSKLTIYLGFEINNSGKWDIKSGEQVVRQYI